MKNPLFDSNDQESFLTFETKEGKFRFGVTGKRLFFEKNEVKVYLTDPSDTLVLPINRSALGISGQDLNISSIYAKEVTLTPADIIAMYATPIELIAAKAGVSFEFLSAVLLYDYETSAYGGGGDVTIRNGDAVVLSNTVTAANILTGGADATRQLTRLNAAGGYIATPNKNLNIGNASGAFTKTTATGVLRVHLLYLEHTTGF